MRKPITSLFDWLNGRVTIKRIDLFAVIAGALLCGMLLSVAFLIGDTAHAGADGIFDYAIPEDERRMAIARAEDSTAWDCLNNGPYVGTWDPCDIGEKPKGKCHTEKKVVALKAYQGYMDNHKYEREVIEETVQKYPEWEVEYIKWDGPPVDPNRYSKRYGYIIFRREVCEEVK